MKKHNINNEKSGDLYQAKKEEEAVKAQEEAYNNLDFDLKSSLKDFAQFIFNPKEDFKTFSEKMKTEMEDMHEETAPYYRGLYKDFGGKAEETVAVNKTKKEILDAKWEDLGRQFTQTNKTPKNKKQRLNFEIAVRPGQKVHLIKIMPNETKVEALQRYEYETGIIIRFDDIVIKLRFTSNDNEKEIYP